MQGYGIRLGFGIIAAATLISPALTAGAALHLSENPLASAAMAAQEDLRFLYNYHCQERGPHGGGSDPVPAPFQVTDSLYYVGASEVAAWAVETTDGIILLDTLNNSAEAQTIIVRGMEQVGLDPNEIRHIVVFHGHYDHMGGAAYLQKTYGTKLWMTDQDWRSAAIDEINKRNGLEQPRLDHAVADGDKLTLGQTTITLHATPGHTPGTISAIIPTTVGGEHHVFALWGGTAFPRDSVGLANYVRSLRNFSEIALQASVDGIISNHAHTDRAPFKIDMMRDDPTANPFVIGEDASQRFFQVMEGCALASLSWVLQPSVKD